MKQHIARYFVWLLLGTLLGEAGFKAFDSWQFWAWMAAFVPAMCAHDWAVRSNDLGNRRAAFGASVLTDGLAGKRTE